MLYIVHFIVPSFLYMLSIVPYIVSALLYMLSIVQYMMSSLLYTRDDQNFLGPLYFGLPGNENLTITFEYISLLGNALVLSLFKLSYPFKIEGLFLVPEVLVYCLYDALIASILCTTKMGFQF